MDNQCKQVLEHLKSVGSITPLEALRKYGILRLGARVYDLRGLGHHIKTTIIVTKSSRGKKRVASYTLIKLNRRAA